MCAGAIVNARLRRLVFGAYDPKAGAVISLMNLVQDRRLNHTVEVLDGICQSECAALLQEFFRRLR
jgi:tRNA(adenine34) deaminase